MPCGSVPTSGCSWRNRLRIPQCPSLRRCEWERGRKLKGAAIEGTSFPTVCWWWTQTSNVAESEEYNTQQPASRLYRTKAEGAPPTVGTRACSGRKFTCWTFCHWGHSPSFAKTRSHIRRFSSNFEPSAPPKVLGQYYPNTHPTHAKHPPTLTSSCVAYR